MIIRRTSNESVENRSKSAFAENACRVATSALLAISLSAIPFTGTASADVMDDIVDVEAQIRTLADEIDQAQDAYNAAQDAQDAAAAKAEENQKEIDRINAELAPHRETLEDILCWEYMNGTDSIVDVLSGSSSISDFFVKMDYVTHIEQTKVETMEEIAVGQDELIAENASLEEQQRIQENAKTEQQAIMDEIQPKIDELNATLDGLRDEQRELLGYKGQAGGGPAYDPPEGGSVVDYALSRVGCPYVWAASGPSSFDCSGLVMWAYSNARGISLPHNSEAQLSSGTRIPVSEAQPGDILWKPGHVGICVKAGGAEYVHAPHSGANVCLVTKGGAGDWSNWQAAVRL